MFRCKHCQVDNFVSGFSKKFRGFSRLKCVGWQLDQQAMCTNTATYNSNETESNTGHNINLLYKRIESLKHPVYPTYRVAYPLIAASFGHYFLEYMLVPWQLQACMLGLPLFVDICHWFIFSYSLKTVLKLSNENGNTNGNNENIDIININDRIKAILQFGKTMDKLNNITFQSALVCQTFAVFTIVLNPYFLNDSMIAGLSLYGKFLVSLSPMTPLMFTLATHEYIFKRVSMEIQDVMEQIECYETIDDTKDDASEKQIVIKNLLSLSNQEIDQLDIVTQYDENTNPNDNTFVDSNISSEHGPPKQAKMN